MNSVEATHVPSIRHSTWAGAAAGAISGAVPGTIILAIESFGPRAPGQSNIELLIVLLGVAFALPAGTIAGALVGAFYKLNPQFSRPNLLQSMVVGGVAGAASILVPASLQSDLSGSSLLLALFPFGMGLGLFGGALWHRFITDELSIHIGRILRIPLVALLGWTLAWAKFEFDPNGPKYVQVTGEVLQYTTHHDSSPGPPLGFYVEGRSIYLPDEASQFLGQRIHAKGFVTERCQFSNSDCYFAIDTEVGGGFLEPYRGFAAEKHIDRARESDGTPTPTVEPSASDETDQ